MLRIFRILRTTENTRLVQSGFSCWSVLFFPYGNTKPFPVKIENLVTFNKSNKYQEIKFSHGKVSLCKPTRSFFVSKFRNADTVYVFFSPLLLLEGIFNKNTKMFTKQSI